MPPVVNEFLDLYFDVKKANRLIIANEQKLLAISEAKIEYQVERKRLIEEYPFLAETPEKCFEASTLLHSMFLSHAAEARDVRLLAWTRLMLENQESLKHYLMMSRLTNSGFFTPKIESDYAVETLKTETLLLF